jgi:hypothetical protein
MQVPIKIMIESAGMRITLQPRRLPQLKAKHGLTQ